MTSPTSDSPKAIKVNMIMDLRIWLLPRLLFPYLFYYQVGSYLDSRAITVAVLCVFLRRPIQTMPVFESIFVARANRQLLASGFPGCVELTVSLQIRPGWMVPNMQAFQLGWLYGMQRISCPTGSMILTYIWPCWQPHWSFISNLEHSEANGYVKLHERNLRDVLERNISGPCSYPLKCVSDSLTLCGVQDWSGLGRRWTEPQVLWGSAAADTAYSHHTLALSCINHLQSGFRQQLPIYGILVRQTKSPHEICTFSSYLARSEKAIGIQKAGSTGIFIKHTLS